jgi:competence protein ComEC
MKRSLVGLALFYCLGIILAGILRLNFWAIAVAGIIVLSTAGLLERKDYIFLILVLLLALLAGSLSLKNSCILPKCHISNFVYYKDNSLYSLSGFIDSAPEFKNNHIWFTFRAQDVQVGSLRWHCCGEVLIKTDFAQKLSYGDNLTLIGNLSRPYNFNTGSQGYKDFLARQGIYLIMDIKDPRQIIRQPKNSGSKLISNSLWLRSRMEQVIRRNLTDLPASILCAMVLGQKRGIPWLVNNSMIRSGTVHILVVSGFNVGIVAFIVNLLFKIMRVPRQVRIILVIICLFIYCLVTGATNPVIRATVMGIVFSFSYLFKRNPDMYNSLASAALFILIINPRQLFDIGFQLSFMSVLAIVCLYPKLKALVHLESCKIEICRFIGDGLLVSFSAWLGTLGIIALNFRIIAPITVLANIFIVPLATIITLCGFSLVFFGLIHPNLAYLFSAPTSMLITLLLNINNAMVKLPLAYIYL